MGRFLSREEWPLVAAGVAAGILTAAVLLYLFFTSFTGEPAAPAAMAIEGDTVSAVADSLERTGAPGGTRAPVIGARELGIQRRLDAHAVSARPLRGPLTITARNVVLSEEGGARFARVDQVTAQLQTAGLARGDVVLDNVVVRRPVVALREDRAGWNYAQVFAELLEGGEPGGPKRLVQLRDVRIENGDITVDRPAQQLAFRNVQGTMPLVVMSQAGVPNPYIRVGVVSLDLFQMEPKPVELAVEIRDGLVVFPEGTVRFELESATLGTTRLAGVEGIWDPATPGYGVTASGRAIDAQVEEFLFMLPPTFPRTGVASFAWSVSPTPTDGTFITLSDLDARTGESHVLGAVSMRIELERFEMLSADLRLDPLELRIVEDFLGRELPYGGSITGSVTGAGGDIAFDLMANLTAETVRGTFATGLTGSVRSTEGGFVLQGLQVALDRVPLAALRPIAPGIALEGFVTGRFGLTGSPGDTPLAVDVRLELANGVAVVEGMVDLTGSVPSYDLSGRLVGIDLQSLVAANVPPAALTAGFTLAGSGVDPATMQATIGLTGRFTGWRTDPGDTLRLAAQIRNGAIRVDTLVAGLATADVAASGDWQFVEPQSGAVRYALSVTSMAPFGPFLPVIGDSVAAGALSSAGTISGTLSRMHLAGTGAVREFSVGGWQAAMMEGQYDVTFGGGALPVAVVDAEVEGLITPTAGHYDQATLALRLTPPALALDVNATRTDGGLVELTATGDLPETGTRRVTIQTARFDLANDQWTLLRPSTLSWTPGGTIAIDGLEVVAAESGGRVFVDGAVYPSGGVDAALEIEAFPIGEIQRLLGQPPRVEGILWADGTLRGGAETSLMDLRFRIDDGSVEGVPLRSAAGSITYRDQETRLVAQVVVDTAGTLDVDVRLPSILRIGASPVFELRDGVPLTGTITADQFALAPLAVTIPQVRDVAGVVNASAVLGGTADAPQVTGSFALRGGAVHVIPLNQMFTEITGDVTFDGRQLTVQDVRARSDGWATLSGRVVLERLDEPVLDLTATFAEFRPMGVSDQTDAAVDGTVTLTGPPSGMVVSGAVTARDGTVVIPQFGGASFNRELMDMTRPATLPGSRTVTSSGWMENARVQNLRVTVGDNAWFQLGETARVQLTGDLTVNRQGESMPIIGTLTGTRGQYTLIAGPLIRRFDIVAAQVRFLGTPTPDPAIDITARRVVLDQGGRQLNVDVRITGTVDSPVLGLAGGEGPAIAESELLSYLIFGQP
ncbi:MAG TPA: translocation/assembly module TamB domain-containing protein, partial [Longimicrobiales bacterium]|nr:translocation/assembly module TamB domain-containing protein [Longimicrobiales bacterium]